MIGGWVLFLAGTLSGIISFGLVVIFVNYVKQLEQELKSLRTELSNVGHYYTDTKAQITTECDKLSVKIGRLDKKLEEYKPVEPNSKQDSGELGNRSV